MILLPETQIPQAQAPRDLSEVESQDDQPVPWNKQLSGSAWRHHIWNLYKNDKIPNNLMTSAVRSQVQFAHSTMI